VTPCERREAVPHDDRPRECCGLFGIWGHPDAARHTYFGLYALQHRGQEAAGIAAGDGQILRLHKGPGLVSQVFTDPRAMCTACFTGDYPTDVPGDFHKGQFDLVRGAESKSCRGHV